MTFIPVSTVTSSLLLFFGTEATRALKCAEKYGINRLVGSRLLCCNLRFLTELATARGNAARAREAVSLGIRFRDLGWFRFSLAVFVQVIDGV